MERSHGRYDWLPTRPVEREMKEMGHGVGGYGFSPSACSKAASILPVMISWRLS